MYLPRDDLEEKITQLYDILRNATQATEAMKLLINELKERCFLEDFEGKEPMLHLAIATTIPEIIDLVLLMPINHHQRNSKKQCPLTTIVLTRNFELLEKYLRLCYSPCQDQDNKTALTYALETGQTDMAKVLMANIFPTKNDIVIAKKMRSPLIIGLMEKAMNYSPLSYDLISRNSDGISLISMHS